MNNRKRVNVRIQDVTYTVLTDEDEKNIKEVAQMVNQKITEIQDRNPVLDTRKAAILAALHFANDYKKAKDEHKGEKK